MSSPMTVREGGCSCGAVRYRLASDPMFVHCCHCLNCQRQTGSAFVINLLMEADRVKLLAGEPQPVDAPRDDGSTQRIFRCPDCQGAVAKEASRRIVDLLVSSGVRMQVWRLPAELSESRVGAPLTPDDLLDFHLLLEGGDWYEQLAAEVRRSLNR